MKKLFIPTLLATIVALSGFAAEGSNGSPAKAPFKRVGDVRWSSSPNCTKATFVWNNVKTEALYDSEGEFLGTNQSISLNDLPAEVKRAFAKKYTNYTLKEATYFEGVQESAYYLNAENEKGSITVKIKKSSVPALRK